MFTLELSISILCHILCVHDLWSMIHSKWGTILGVGSVVLSIDMSAVQVVPGPWLVLCGLDYYVCYLINRTDMADNMLRSRRCRNLLIVHTPCQPVVLISFGNLLNLWIPNRSGGYPLRGRGGYPERGALRTGGCPDCQFIRGLQMVPIIYKANSSNISTIHNHNVNSRFQ